MRRGSFFSLLREDELSLGAGIGWGPDDVVRAGLAADFGGGTMASKLSFKAAGGVGGNACFGGLTGKGGRGGIGLGTSLLLLLLLLLLFEEL
jgi:hypothetical protein